MQQQLARTQRGALAAPSSAAARRPARRGLAVTAAFKQGDRVRVARPVVVYHVGKFKDGLNLEGLEGTVVENVSNYKGHELSANLPWKVQLQVEAEGKPVKVLAHLEEDELTAA